MDLRQFNCPDQEKPSWFERGERAVRMLEPVARTLPRKLVVADVGCGDMKVREFLQRGGFAFEYRAYDLVPQSAVVISLDVSREAPAGADVVMMLGVGEYIENLPAALRRLALAAPYLLLSHVVREYSSYTPERLRELGWVNHMTEAEFSALLEAAGWRIDHRELTANKRTMLWLAHSAHVRPA
jgi:hypothetical protein